jgi:uncharacterized membrane protein YfcA
LVDRFELLVAGVGVVAGGVASLAGFGVGSLLTPLLIPTFGGRAAVALVALPHAIATASRLWHMRRDIAWSALTGFGTASAAGGLAGALLFTRVEGPVLILVLAALLVVVGMLQLTGQASRLRMDPAWAPAAGAASGLFGGLVGNQGGLRSAGLLSLGLTARPFVATGAAIALLVDLVRVPIYIVSDGATLVDAWRIGVAATLGVVIGTFAGTRLLLHLSETTFRRVVGVSLVGLGVWLMVQAQQVRFSTTVFTCGY